MEEFEEVTSKIKKKKSYNFLTRAGDPFKESVFKICRRRIKEEQFPSRFFETRLHQLWKGKFSKEDLSNHRFIHMKDWLPKCVEAVAVNRMKQNIL